ncbi:MAG: hypothetical protein M3044_16340, partial [Thermoproteota archaeon]|nr:hypothetical protein [Thermoproteota archaeon]
MTIISKEKDEPKEKQRIVELIDGITYTFDTNDCVLTFKKFRGVYVDELLVAMNISSHQKHRKGQGSYTMTQTELQFEIECPRCYNTMELCSDFNGLPYFCELCGFSLHT